MSTSPVYVDDSVSVAEIEKLSGPVVIDFGTNWCEFCQGAKPLTDTALARFPRVRHFRFEDGKGRIPGRAFKVKLWPTLIFLRDGIEVTRLVRPHDVADIEQALRLLSK